MAGIDTIKRAARKEAWYGDPYNPFRKMTRSSTWAQPPSPTGTGRDVEAAIGAEDASPLSKVRQNQYQRHQNSEAIAFEENQRPMNSK